MFVWLAIIIAFLYPKEHAYILFFFWWAEERKDNTYQNII